MDIDIKELVKAAAEGFDLSKFKGDVVGVKIVENQFGNIESGGIGIQINNGKDAPIAKSDKDIKSAIEALLAMKDEKNAYLFQNKKQWWAVYRVLFYFCNYPTQMTAFETKMKELEVAKVDGKRDLSYESLSAAVKEVPFMATCSPATWNTLRDRSDHYKQQYVVADFLMQKLGVKS